VPPKLPANPAIDLIRFVEAPSIRTTRIESSYRSRRDDTFVATRGAVLARSGCDCTPAGEITRTLCSALLPAGWSISDGEGRPQATERSDVISAAYRTAPIPIERDYAAVAADPLIVLHAAAPFNLQGLEFLFSEVHLPATTRKIPSFPQVLSRVRFAAERTDEWIWAPPRRDILFRLTG
jgi:hypothetical protein